MADHREHGSLGESAEWEEAYQLTRRSLGVRRQRLQFFDLEPHHQILDLGTGDGLDIRVLQDMGLGMVTGFDVSLNLLAKAPGRKVIGDSHRLPFEPASFDAVLANSVLHHFDMTRAAAEAARVLKPGGRLCYIEPRPCLARTVLDTVTNLPGVGLFSSVLKARRIALSEEMDVYSNWLNIYADLPTILEPCGFSLEKKRHTLVAVVAQWRRQ